VVGIDPTQVQDLALGLIEPHEVHIGPLLELVQFPLDGIPSLRRVDRTIPNLNCDLAVKDKNVGCKVYVIFF